MFQSNEYPFYALSIVELRKAQQNVSVVLNYVKMVPNDVPRTGAIGT